MSENVQILTAISMLLFMLIIIFLFIFSILNNRKINKMIKKYHLFMKDVSGDNLDAVMETCINNIEMLKTKSKEFESKLNNIERNVLQCIQKIGIIRYTAFENVGSDLSFAIALLDSYDTGVLINGVYSRDNSSVYAKAVVNGSSKYVLSAEEIQALEIAKKSYRERPYTA